VQVRSQVPGGLLALSPPKVALVQARCEAVTADTVGLADPVTVGEDAEAVKIFAPAANKVALSVVVLTPAVKLTEPVG
jgi:hypothetical protein